MNTLVQTHYVIGSYFRKTSIYQIYYIYIKQATINMNLYTFTLMKQIDALVKLSLQYLHNILLKGINILVEKVNIFSVTKFVGHFDGWSKYSATSIRTRHVF